MLLVAWPIRFMLYLSGTPMADMALACGCASSNSLMRAGIRMLGPCYRFRFLFCWTGLTHDSGLLDLELVYVDAVPGQPKNFGLPKTYPGSQIDRQLARSPGTCFEDSGQLHQPVYGPLRAVSTQLADRIYVFDAHTRNKGLCLQLKNHAFDAWMLILRSLGGLSQ